MKKILLISLLFLAACGTLQDNEQLAQKYVPGTEDLPVYEGFKPVDAKNVAYDSESGRIIDAGYFSNHTKAAEVKQFYSETLPQLGWKKKNGEYMREGERLKVNITEKGDITFLKFNIRPVN
jgi:hypothetical protein